MLKAASREVGTSDSVEKQHIAAEEFILAGEMKAETVWRMPRHMIKLEFFTADFDLGLACQDVIYDKFLHRISAAANGSKEVFQSQIF